MGTWSLDVGVPWLELKELPRRDFRRLEREEEENESMLMLLQLMMPVYVEEMSTLMLLLRLEARLELLPTLFVRRMYTYMCVG
jgi:hypothetical protein